MRTSLSVFVEYKEHEKSRAVVAAQRRMSEEILRITSGGIIPETESPAVNEISEDGYMPAKEGDVPDAAAGSAAAASDDKEKNAASEGSGSNVRGRNAGGRRYRKESDNPDVIFGRDFDDAVLSIADLEGMTGEVTVYGKVIRLETRETKTGKLMVIFDITDQTDTITVKMFPRLEQKERLFAYLAEGCCIYIKAVASIDKFDGELSLGYVSGIKKAEEKTGKVRMDTAEEKRVELHCHTKMSDMDGVSDVGALMKRAAEWGHKALAGGAGIYRCFSCSSGHKEEISRL